MPVTPTQARKLYKEREELLEKVDEAILAAYANGIPARVEVIISEEQFKNESLAEWLRNQYEEAGWKTHFDRYPVKKAFLFVLTEATK